MANHTKNYRYYVSYLLDDLPVGARFKPSVLHVTVLPWFALETDEGPFLNWFYEHFAHLPAFDAVAASRDMFGPKQDVPVSILEPKAEFMKLHNIALSWFGAVGARWAERDPYVGDDYVPHIAQRQGFVIEPNQTLRIGSLSLFKAGRQQDQVRMVAAKAIFDDQI
jgi:hypothetical protein